MKKLTALLLAFMLMLGAFAEDMFIDELFVDDVFVDDGSTEEQQPLPTVLTVAGFTRPSGCFFTDLFGGNTADTDVARMLHGLNTVVWSTETEYVLNPTVVKEQRYLNNSDGSREYIITINTGLMYSDGGEVTAADYVFSILLQASPQLNELGASEGYTYIKGYGEYHSGQSEIFTGVRLYSSDTFSITVSADYLLFYYENGLLSVDPYPARVIAPGNAAKDDGSGAYIGSTGLTVTDEEGNTRDYTFTSELLYETIFGENGYMSHPSVVTGPYTLTSYDEETGKCVFAINPYYAGNFEGVKPTIETVEFFYADPDTVLEQLENGSILLLNKAASQETVAGALSLNLSTANYARRGMGMLAINCKGALSDVSLRQAIAMLIDADGFTEEYLGTLGMRVYGYYGIGQWMVQVLNGALTPENLTPAQEERLTNLSLDSLVKYDYDPAAAKEALKDKNLTLTIAKASESKACAAFIDYITPAFEEAGITLVVKEMSFKEMAEDMYSTNKQCDLYFVGTNFSMVFDPTLTFSQDAACMGTCNFTEINDELLAELAANVSAVEPGDSITYLENWLEFEKRFAEVLPAIPLYSDVYYDFYTPLLSGYDINSYASWAEAILYCTFAYPQEGISETDDDMLF